MAVYGGDLAQLEGLSSQFLREIDAVDGLQSRIAGALEGTAWTGPAAERFRTQWSQEFVPALLRLKQALSEGASVVTDRRKAIEMATS
ncbi:MAG: WXG100 family type VII secretion target [Acidimicrobiia bacterium]|nr:WXG100 family type VII secretion target [Acidimicrobiia bacterium]MDH3399055.1 WXG100 family type VII secretion target [Acidimicrobiia bacterium]MDH5615252.1 WXG100 family type VII secretion target [Acidimicrobiia bacterium]